MGLMKQRRWSSFYRKQHNKTEREPIPLENRVENLEYKVETLERTLAQLVLAIQRKARKTK